MTSEPTNDDRADWAEEAMIVFGSRTQQIKGGVFDADHEEIISDLIADLLHLANRNGLNVSGLIERATEHYVFELTEET